MELLLKANKKLMVLPSAKLLPNPMLNAGVGDTIWSDGEMTFYYKDCRYFISVVYVKRFFKIFRFSGIEIGYGGSVFCKKISFGFENQNVFVDKNYKKSISFVRGFLSEIENKLNSIITDDDIVTFFSVGNSRLKTYIGIFKKNGWRQCGECFFKNKPDVNLYRGNKIFGNMFDAEFKLSKINAGSTCI